MNDFSLPPEFLRRVQQQLGEEFPDFLSAMEREPVRALRLNPFRCFREEDIPGLLEAIPWEPTGRGITPDSVAGGLVQHEAGCYYLQEPAAMLPAAVLDARPGETVLDLCAAPGGKSTQSALRMQGKGLLVCNEPVPSRAKVLSGNLERMGIPNALVVSAYPDALARRWPGGFDAVQVDAPCSGEGMFRRHPETRAEWTPETAHGCALRQAEILDQAAVLVRRGGRIVYSTCTLNPEENEKTVLAFLDRHPDFSLFPFSLPGIEAPEGMFTSWPQRTPGEGQFTALLRRSGDEEARLPQGKEPKKPDKALLSLWNAAFGKKNPQPTHQLGNTLVHLEACPDISGLKVLRCGLHLAGLQGKQLLPDHAWAMSLQAPDFPRCALTPGQALDWLRGEAIPCPEELRGWLLADYRGLVLGWGKASDGLMRNHYPKGLRRAVRLPDR